MVFVVIGTVSEIESCYYLLKMCTVQLNNAIVFSVSFVV